jgi:hypothetical protein
MAKTMIKEEEEMYPDLRTRFQPLSITQVFLFILMLSFTALGQSCWYQPSAFCDGEWLKFKVRWGFIRLGTIEIFQEKIVDDHALIFKVKMHAESVNLPFIDVFFINEGTLNLSQPTLQHFTLTTGKEAENVTTYDYNSQSKTVVMKTVERGQIVRYDSLIYTETLYDALGIFMSMRCLSASGFNVTLNNIVDFKISQTHLNFSGEIERIKVSAFREKQDALKFFGKADWVGKAWAGVSGPFHGWISNDSCAIPLKVQVKIFLGSITLELEEFYRDDSTHSFTNSILVRN